MKTEKKAIGPLKKSYDSLAWMNLTAHLYNLTESVHDGKYGMDSGLQEELNGIYGQLLSCIRDYSDSGERVREDVIGRISGLREKVVECSEQVQVLCDSLQIYEYLLNRVEYSLREYDKPFDDEEEARELLRTIFASQDPTEVNLRIQLMVSQLPVRITKTRFFDLIKASFSIYESSDEDALEGFYYRIVSAAAMQKRPEGKVFSEYLELIQKLEELDTETLDKDTVAAWQDCIANSGDNLSQDADYLLAIQECINAFYTVVLMDIDSVDEQTKAVMLPAVGAIAEYGFAALSAKEEPLHEGALGPAFAYMEGRLEPLSERVLKDEAKIDAYCENDAEFADTEEGRNILIVKKLMSTSSFAKLSEQKIVMVTKDKLNAVTADALAVLEDGMKNHKRAYNRCVMASVLKELPVFFNSHTEVMNYVLQSLHNCSNEGEKRGAVAMLWDLLGTKE